MRDWMRIMVSVAGWMVRLLLWNVAALLPLIGDVRPSLTAAWLALVVAFLTLRYVLPRGEALWPSIKRGLATQLPRPLGWIFALGIAGTMLNLAFAALGGDFLGGGDNKQELALQAYANRPGGTAVLVLFFVCFAPCFEEFVFRGKILGLLKSPLGPRGAVLVSALLFGALHAGQTGGVLGRVCAGLVAGEAVLATGSLWSAIAVHAINNAVASIAFVIGPEPASATPPSAPSVMEAILLALVSTLAIEFILRRIRPAPVA